MKIKSKFIAFILCAIVICVYVVAGSYNYIGQSVNKVYKVYLDGEFIGAIENKDTLYDLIDDKQQAIKDKYKVENVYPPNGLEVVESYSYNTPVSNLTDIYNKIEQLQDFTIYGYEIKISETNSHDAYSIYVLKKETFTDAIKDFILAFIDEDGYYNYMNGSQEELDDVGVTYHDMKFLEDVTIREKYISINLNFFEIFRLW